MYGLTTRLEVRSCRGELMAWTNLWFLDTVGNQHLVATPRLHLCQDTALDLCAGHSYRSVFAGAKITMDEVKYGLLVLHATFTLWQSGEPDLSQVAFALLDGKFDPSSFTKYVSHSAEMLR